MGPENRFLLSFLAFVASALLIGGLCTFFDREERFWNARQKEAQMTDACLDAFHCDQDYGARECRALNRKCSESLRHGSFN